MSLRVSFSSVCVFSQFVPCIGSWKKNVHIKWYDGYAFFVAKVIEMNRRVEKKMTAKWERFPFSVREQKCFLLQQNTFSVEDHLKRYI